MANLNTIANNSIGVTKNNFIRVPNRRFIPKDLWQVVCTSIPLSSMGCKLNKITGGSMAFSLNKATEGAFGELIERYSSGIYDNSNFLVSSFNGLRKIGKNALNPDKIRYFSEAQYVKLKYQNIYPLSKDDIIEWTKGYDIISETDIYVPAFMVYMPYYSKHNSKKEFLKHATSTGLAAGPSLKEAVKNGLYECIERDAFAKFWYKQENLNLIKYRPSQIINAFKNNKFINLLLDNPRIQISVFDLANISIAEAIVTFIFFKYKGFNLMSIGASANIHKDHAIIKSVKEAYQGIEYTINLKGENLLPKKIDLSAIDSFDKHFLFYNQFPEYRSEVKIINAAENNYNFAKEVIKPKFSCNDDIFDKNILKSFGLDHIIYVDITPMDAAQLQYFVARVLTPDLSLLSGHFKYPFLGTGFEGEESIYLKLPHPFP